MPETVECEGIVRDGVDVEEIVTLGYANGLRVTAVISFVRDVSQKLVITGTEGKIKCHRYHCADKATLIKNLRRTVFKGNSGYDNEFNIVADEILSGKLQSEYVPLKSTLDVMEIMDECRRQMGLRYPFEYPPRHRNPAG